MTDDKLAALTYEERQRLFVLSGIPRRSQDEEVEFTSLKARAEATDQPPPGGVPWWTPDPVERAELDRGDRRKRRRTGVKLLAIGIVAFCLGFKYTRQKQRFAPSGAKRRERPRPPNKKLPP